MKIYLHNDIDSTVADYVPAKFDSPGTPQLSCFMGDLDNYYKPLDLIKAINDSTMNLTGNSDKFILQNLIRNITKIKSFAKLPVNWNDNGAVKFTNKLIVTTIEILTNLDYQPEVFPTARASILLEYGKPGGKFFGIEVFEDRIEAFITPERETLKFDLWDIEELRKKVNKFND